MPENDKNNDNKKKKSRFSLRKLIYNDKYLIIISLLLAITLWCATSMNLSPQTTKTITVPVSVDFSDTAAAQLGLKSFGDETIDVDVTISCKKYLAKEITADDLNVYLQTNTVTTNGNFEVPIRVEGKEGSDFSIVSFYPTVYQAYFDVEEEKVMDISVEYENDDFIADGYVMGEAVLSESSVTLKGPKTYLSQVDRVVARVNFDEKIKATQNLDVPIIAVDKNSGKVNYISIVTKNENINLTIPVLKRTRLNVTSSFIGKPSNLNISDFDVSYSVKSVNAGVLEEAKIEQANIGNIDFSKLRVGKNTFKFDVTKMESFAILDNINEITVTVTVPDSYTSKDLSVGYSNVELTNVPGGYKAEIVSLNSNSITAIGKEADLDSISSSNVKFIVDLTDKNEVEEGTKTYNVTATLEGSGRCWVYGTYEATVRIYK